MNIIGLSGSPTGGSSTDFLLQTVLDGASANHVKTRLVRLNEKRILPCQACGKSPEPEYCFFHDDMDGLFSLMEKSDGIVLASPIFFDSVSAQTKLFIDRTNCLRPPDFSSRDKAVFKEPLFKGKKGGIIIVGGEKENYDSTFRTARGFFIWAGIEIVFELKYSSSGWEPGSARSDNEIISRAKECGNRLLSSIAENNKNANRSR